MISPSILVLGWPRWQILTQSFQSVSMHFLITSLASITIPRSVSSIEGCTFSNCTLLKSVFIPISVTLIKDESFKHCSSLNRSWYQTQPHLLIAMHYNCIALASITIPESPILEKGHLELIMTCLLILNKKVQGYIHLFIKMKQQRNGTKLSLPFLFF